MTKFRLGFENKLYIGTKATAPTTKLTNITDVTVSLESAEVDVTARNSGKFKTYIPGMIDAGLEFKIFSDADDAGLSTLRTAWLARDAVSVKIDLGDNAYFQSDMIITNFTNDQATEDATAYNVSMKPTITSSDFLPTIETGADGSSGSGD